MPVTSVHSFLSQEFDYLIIGGGTAGLVVAARLSEDPNVIVGVLEAGEYIPNIPEITIPGHFGRVINDPKYDWAFTSVEQKHLNGRVTYQTRGKNLGGSSNINFMCSGRASAGEYNAFEKLGNPGWNWQSLLYYMKKGESFVPPSTIPDSAHGAVLDPKAHGTNGPLKQTYPLWHSELHHLFLKACETTGLSINPDPASGENIGVSSLVATIDPETATRVSSYTAYFEPNKERPNLMALIGAQATRVIFNTNTDPEDIIANGVDFIHNGLLYTAKAKREIVLSAGSFQTPQLLELSGIGQKKYTTDIGIKQLIDLPGDHAIVYNSFEVQSHFSTAEATLNREHNQVLLDLYKTKQQGLYTVMTSAWGFLPAQVFMNIQEMSMIKNKYIQAIEHATTPGLRRQLQLQLDSFNDTRQAQSEVMPYAGMMPTAGVPEIGKKYLTIMTMLSHTLSRGHVHISSSDATVPPVINPQYLSSSVDLDILIAMCKYVHKLTKTEPLKSAIIHHDPEAHNDEELAEYVRNSAGPVYHPVGTASMLPREDRGVVNPRLIVYGTRNLRIVDASIIPVLFSAHTMATVYGIAEKAADLIKEDHALSDIRNRTHSQFHGRVFSKL